MLHEEEHTPFDVYFASLMSMQVHPGAGAKENRPLTMAECRDMALKMVEMRRSVLNGKES